MFTRLQIEFRRRACRRVGCTHDLALCENAEADCAAAGWSAHSAAPEVLPPPLMRQAMSFTVAKTRDVLHGFPRRAEEEIARITAICEGCAHFVSASGRCGICWCPLKDKIPMQMERCPENKW